MKYVDEFRNKAFIKALARRIRVAAGAAKCYSFMEVCGTHTMNVFRFGLRGILPSNIKLLSGPGCPVCVTPDDFIDKAVELSRMKNIIMTTFGDMLRVPGSASSLEKERAKGAVVKTVYSTEDALKIAARNPGREVVFVGVGFETTSPTVAASIMEAKRDGLHNFSVLCGHKTMPEALEALARDRRLNVDGFLLPGHVSAIIGSGPYEFLCKKHNKACVIAGFEPTDILQALLMLVEQRPPKVEVQYARVINKKGNPLARKIMEEVFDKTDSAWRGMGNIADSGLAIKRRYSDFDAQKKFDVRVKKASGSRSCICGDVLKGLKKPTECRLFAKTCTPEKPVGPCMVSSEGTCAAYYRYGK